MSIAVQKQPDEVKSTLQSARETLGSAKTFNKVMSRCLLVTMTFNRWRGLYQIDKAQTLSDGKVIPEELSTPGKWKLIPDELNKSLNALESSARSILARRSVSFKLPSVYIVPISAADKLFEDLKRIRLDLEEAADNFCSPQNYKTILQELFKKVNSDTELFKTVKGLLPSRDKLRSKFGITCALVPIGSLNTDFEDNASEFIKEAQAETRKFIKESIESMLSEPRKELENALLNLSSILQKRHSEGSVRSSVRQASIDNVRAALQKLKDFSFIADDQLLDQMNTLDSQLAKTTPKELNSSLEISQSINATLKSIAAKAADDDAALLQFDKFSRSLDFEE